MRGWILILILMGGCIGPPSGPETAGAPETATPLAFSAIDGAQLREGVAEVTTMAGTWAAIEVRLSPAHWGEDVPFDGNGQVQVDYEIVGDTDEAVVLVGWQNQQGKSILDPIVMPLPMQGQTHHLFATTDGGTPPNAPPEHPMILVFGAADANVTLRIGLGGFDHPTFPAGADHAGLRAAGGLGLAQWTGSSWSIQEYGGLTLEGKTGQLPGGRSIRADAEVSLAHGTAVAGFGATGQSELRRWDYDISVGDQRVQAVSHGAPLLPPPIEWDLPYGSPGVRVQSDDADRIVLHAAEEAVASSETDSFALAVWGHVDASLAALFDWPPFEGVFRPNALVAVPGEAT